MLELFSRVALAGWLLATVALSVTGAPSLPHPGGSDKLAHFLAYALHGGLCAFAFAPRRGFGTALVGASPASADEGSERRFSVRPELRAMFVADDNVDLRRGGEEDLAVWLRPRVDLLYDRQKLSAGAQLGGDLRWYFDTNRLREAFADIVAWVEGEPLPGLTLRVSDAFVPRSVRLGRPGDATANLVQTNRLQGELRWRTELPRRRGLELGARGLLFQADGFPSSLDLDRNGTRDEFGDLQTDHVEGQGWIEFQYGLGRSSLVFLRSELRNRSYREISSDFFEVAGLVGSRVQLGRRFRMEGALGWGRVDFQDIGPESRLVGRGELIWELPEAWTLRGSFVRRIATEAAGVDFGETSVRLDVEKGLGRRTRAELGLFFTHYDRDVAGEGGSHAEAVQLRLRRQLARRVELELAYRYWRNRGNAIDDDFQQNRVILGLHYRH